MFNKLKMLISKRYKKIWSNIDTKKCESIFCTNTKKQSFLCTKNIIDILLYNAMHYFVMQASLSYLDSPSTTSAVTYKTQGRPHVIANTGQAYFQVDGVLSAITLMEVAG
jgi:hypothetical protein